MMRFDAYQVRPITIEDGAVFAHFMDVNGERFRPAMPAFDTADWSVEHWNAQIERWVEQASSNALIKFVIVSEDGAILGDITYSNIVFGPFCACYLAYKVDGAHEGLGVMRRALELTNAYVFKELGLHRIMANHRPENLASAGLLRRLGFVVEGYAKDYLKIDGKWRDHVLTSKTAPLSS